MRNMLLHWIPYRHLPDAAGYRPFRIPYNLMACIFPEAHPPQRQAGFGLPWIGGTAYFFLESKASHSFRSTRPDPGITPRPRHSESQGSISSSISFCASGLPLTFYHTGIAIHKERFSFLKTYQCNSQCRKQLLRCKACHHTTDAFLCQMLAERSSCDRIDMSGIKEHIRTAFNA